LIIWSPIYAELEKRLNSENSFVIIISPYIKLDPLKKILSFSKHPEKVLIITQWSNVSVVSETSDIDIYPFLSDLGTQLYIHQNIHLKLYILMSNQSFLTSANLTNSGMGIPNTKNIEIGTFVELCKNDLIEIDKLFATSLEVTAAIYEIYKQYKIMNLNKNSPLPEIELPKENLPDNLFPALSSPEKLFKYLAGILSPITYEEREKLRHDIKLFNLTATKISSKKEFYKRIRTQLRTNKAIKEIVGFVKTYETSGKKYPFPHFGIVKEWITFHFSKKPSRYEFIEITQLVYKWLSFTYPNNIRITVPGKHSEVLEWHDTEKE